MSRISGWRMVYFNNVERLEINGAGGDDEFFVLGTNPDNADSDGDGVGDGAEVMAGLDAKNADTDGDGVNDGADGCALDPKKSAPGTCGCGTADTDSDADGAADCVDACVVPEEPRCVKL